MKSYTLDTPFVAGDHIKAMIKLEGAFVTPGGFTYGVYQAPSKPASVSVSDANPAGEDKPRPKVRTAMFVRPNGEVVVHTEGEPLVAAYILFTNDIGHSIRRLVALPGGGEAALNVGEFVSQLKGLAHCTVPDDLPHHPGTAHLHGEKYAGADTWADAHDAKFKNAPKA